MSIKRWLYNVKLRCLPWRGICHLETLLGYMMGILENGKWKIVNGICFKIRTLMSKWELSPSCPTG